MPFLAPTAISLPKVTLEAVMGPPAPGVGPLALPVSYVHNEAPVVPLKAYSVPSWEPTKTVS